MNDDINEKTIAISGDPDFYEDLSDYLNVLSNPTRLRILKLIEHHPKEVREIAKEIDTSYENTKKHLDKLLNTGVIKKEAGLGRQTSKGSLPVWKYSLIPGGMEGIIRNLSIFSNIDIRIGEGDLNSKLQSVRSMLEDENRTGIPVIIILGGDDDGKAYPLKENEVLIGREDQTLPDISENGAIILSPGYEAVTRVTKPHGKFIKRGDDWFFKDCRSTGGSFINNKKITPEKEFSIKNGDMLDLAKGARGARLIFNIN
ncbi:MAG: ArsR family transcriptional regulator [Methanomicrobiaceae archaeon]|nr:ArsR family transcriptional regulator [Methanomicrobiaceae archaeon]